MILEYEALDVQVNIIPELSAKVCQVHGLVAVLQECIQGDNPLPGLVMSPKLVGFNFLHEVCLELETFHAWGIEYVAHLVNCILKRLVFLFFVFSLLGNPFWVMLLM